MGGSSKKQTIGYRYYVGMHHALCHGPIDALLGITVDDKEAWAGINDGSSKVTIDKTDLFGGDKREGGISGDISVLRGEPDQARNAYLENAIGSGFIPAFRGICSMVLEQVYIGLNPYLKPWKWKVSRIHKTDYGETQWYDEKAAIPTGVSADLSLFWEMNAGSLNHDNIYHVDSITPGATQSTTFAPGDGAVHTLKVRAIGSIELRTYTGSTAVAGTIVKGGTPGADYSYNLYKMEISNPAATYYFNNGTSAETLTDIDEEFEIEVADGATITYTADDEDGNMIGTYQSLSVAVNAADMNPAHIIREAYTSPEFGLGYPSADIDSDGTFTDSADTLYNELMGISILWDKSSSVEDFIADILRHIDGATYMDRTTGKICLKLIRDDYDPGSLIELDESNILRLENFKRSTMADLYNEIVCSYWDAETDAAKTFTIQNLALIQAMGGIVSTSVSYPGFTNFDLANRAAYRDLKALGTPRISGTLYVNRVAYGLNPGDCFKLSLSKFGLSSAIMRVSNVIFGGPLSNEIGVNFIEDTFTAPDITIGADPGVLWESPHQDPQAPAAHIAFELPYMALIKDRGEDAVNTRLDAMPDAGYIGAAAVRPNYVSLNAEIDTDSGDGYVGYGTLDFCPSCILAAAIGYTTEAVTIENAVDVDLIGAGTWGQIDDEIVVVDAIDGDAGTATIRRGCLDTVPAEHAAGARLYIWEDYTAGDGVEYVDTEEIDVKLLTVTGGGVLDIDDATADTVTMDSRAIRPYPPGNLQINSESYPDEPQDGEITISWAHRDRTQQTSGTYLDYSDGDVGPETGVTYTFYGYIDDVLDDTQTGLSGTSTTWTPTTEGTARVEVYAVRDGYDSWQAATCEFLYGAGGVRVTEAGDDRITEDGDIRTTE